jgi:hypothetical protein
VTSSYWKTGSPTLRREQLAWPSLAQVLGQLAIVAMVSLLWAVLFFGYLRLTSPQTGTPGAAESESVAVVTATPTATPSVTPSAPTTTATASVVDTVVVDIPAAPTPTVMPEPTTGEMPSPEPSPTPTDTPAPSPTPTELPVFPTNTSVPTEGPVAVSFSGDVLPIFQRRCVKCHGGERTEEGLILISYSDVMAGSWNGPVIEPGSPADSFLVEQIVSGKMPKRGPRLLPSEIQAISDWIDSGALDN